MGLSKSSRIIILLAIDSAFFLLELVVGSAVHSLALVADSFHMLNDVLSLCVGLWAVKVANEKTQSRSYTYGWQRAETLGALVNGVFLVALCLSIFLEAIQRFVEPQEVSNPKLILIVGSLGLLSNILGLFLFHDHGHSHGGHSHGGGDHGHSHGNDLSAAEEGHGHSHSHYGSVEHSVNAVADQSGNVADVLPQNRIGGWPQTKSMNMDSSDVTFVEDGSHQHSSSKARSKGAHSRSRSRGYSGYSGIPDLPVHPASFRNEIINASRLEYDPASAEETENEDGSQNGNTGADESTALLGASSKSSKKANGHSHSHSNEDWHAHHNHKQPKENKKGGHGHSHDDLNMKGVFLHVLGDALGNVGVIASALFIWLTDFSWRFYSDPAISLIITVIILCSAIPLCKAASRILLQATPEGIDVAELEIDILDLPGIISCHHVHVWQLSDSKYVASLHVQVDFDFKGEGSARYMELARAIRRCLHGHGIHSSTIQPEFCLDETHDHTGSQHSDDETHGGSENSGSRRQVRKQASKTGSLRDEPEACLLECGDACDNNNKCCPPGAKDAGNDGA